MVVFLVVFMGLLASPVGPKAFGDLEFHADARALSAAVRGEGEFGDVRLTKAPGPVFFYAAPYLFVPAGSAERVYWRAGVTWTASWIAVSMLLLRRVATALAGERAGRIALALSLLSPFSLYYSLGILAEGPAYLGAAVFLYGWVSRRSNGRAAPATLFLIGGLLLVISSRPNAVVILAVAGVAWLWLRRSDRAGAAIARDAAFGGALGVMLISGLLSMMPGRAAGSPQASYFFDMALQGRYQYRTETWDWRFWDTQTREGSVDFASFLEREGELDARARAAGVPEGDVVRDWVLADTLGHPFLTLKMAAVRALSLHVNLINSRPASAFAVGPLPAPVVYWTVHVIINAVGLSIVALALVFLWRERQHVIALWPLWGLWLALVVFHAAVYAEPRYLLPSKAGQIVLASCGAVALVKALATRALVRAA